jgi:hypothetical protein
MIITLDVSERALKKMRTQVITKRLLGSDYMTLSDVILAKIVDGFDDDREVIEIKTKDDV